MQGSTMEDDLAMAEGFLRTMIDFLENGSVESLVEGEVTNYFLMCKQIEIYHEKFKCKGYYMCMDVNTGVFSLTRSDVFKAKYDLSKLADKLFMKFCIPSTPSFLLSRALSVFMKDFGAQRLGSCVTQLAGLKQLFCVETVINRANQHNFNLDASLLMEGYESISTKPNGMSRVRDALGELIIEDECADTVVSMFSVQNELDPRICVEIKKLLLERLREKFVKQPHVRLWLKIVCSISIIESINAYEPLLEFVLDLVKFLSTSITCKDSEKKDFYSPPGALSYEELVHVITKFYKNKKSCQTIINFIFNQCGANPAVWYSVLDSCHNMPSTGVAALPYYDYSLPDMISAPSLEWRN